MKLLDSIKQVFYRKYQILHEPQAVSGFGISCYPFGDTIFRNIVELLTDLCNDVQWHNISGRDALRVAEFVTFFEREARAVLWNVYRYGYCVIGVNEFGALRIMRRNEYKVTDVANGTSFVEPLTTGYELHVISSEVYREEQRSDYDICKPFIRFLDNVMNASSSATEKLGTFVVATPETPNGFPTPIIMNKDQKQELEREIEQTYGALNKQRHIMLLPRGMNFQTVSLEGVDRKLSDKVRLCVLAICDRIKVPANQVSIIDANSSRSLSNGSELREGDFNKYQSFERLLNGTFVKLSCELRIGLNYTIYNKPERGTEIQSVGQRKNY